MYSRSVAHWSCLNIALRCSRITFGLAYSHECKFWLAANPYAQNQMREILVTFCMCIARKHKRYVTPNRSIESNEHFNRKCENAIQWLHDSSQLKWIQMKTFLTPKFSHRIQTTLMKHYIWHRLNSMWQHHINDSRIGYPDFTINEIKKKSATGNTSRMIYKCTSK